MMCFTAYCADSLRKSCRSSEAALLKGPSRHTTYLQEVRKHAAHAPSSVCESQPEHRISTGCHAVRCQVPPRACCSFCSRHCAAAKGLVQGMCSDGRDAHRACCTCCTFCRSPPRRCSGKAATSPMTYTPLSSCPTLRHPTAASAPLTPEIL